MADVKITGLPASAGLVAADLFAVVDDVSGTPVTQKATGTQVVSLVESELNIAAGTWTPTLTEVSNLNAATTLLRRAWYQRIGDIVAGSVRVRVFPTASGAWSLRVTLPVASNLGSLTLGGTGSANNTSTFVTALPDSINDEMLIEGEASSTSAHEILVSFAYDIV